MRLYLLRGLSAACMQIAVLGGGDGEEMTGEVGLESTG